MVNIKILDLPGGLVEHLNKYITAALRRIVYVFLDGVLLSIPGEHYIMDLKNEIIIVKVEMDDNQVLTIADFDGDERWYWRDGSWGRM